MTSVPVVMGTNWYAGMMAPSTNGILSVKGRSVGGHAYLLLGYDDNKSMALIQNSWGQKWGVSCTSIYR